MLVKVVVEVVVEVLVVVPMTILSARTQLFVVQQIYVTPKLFAGHTFKH